MGCNYLALSPDPSRYTILEEYHGAYAYMLKVHYNGCTNFEGVKVIVYKGVYKVQSKRDPHFKDGSELSPIARFIPNTDGIIMAKELVDSILVER